MTVTEMAIIMLLHEISFISIPEGYDERFCNNLSSLLQRLFNLAGQI